MLGVNINTIDHAAQRYDTVGDWQTGRHENRLYIQVSELGNWRYEALVAVHELVEALLCRHAGVTQAQVDEFDMRVTPNISPYWLDDIGDLKDCPYRDQHNFATAVERMMCAAMGIAWKDYDDAVMMLRSPVKREAQSP